MRSNAGSSSSIRRRGPVRIATISLLTGVALAVASVIPAHAVVRMAMPSGPTVTGQTGARPNASRLNFPVSDQVQASVDVGTGNLMVSAVGISLIGVNRSVPIGTTFNSLSTAAGASGNLTANKWQLATDGAGTLATASGGYVYTGADGSTWLYTQIAGGTPGTYSTPGMKALLASNQYGYTLTDLTTRRVVNFSVDGVATKVTDKNGNITNLAQNSGGLASVQAPAGPSAARSASVGYVSGTRTLTVTQTNGSQSRSWKYVKDSSQNLTSIVDAMGKTTVFAYTSGKLTQITSTIGAVTNFTYDASGKISQVDQLNTTAGSPGTSTTRLTYPSATQTLVAGPNTNTATAVASVPHVTYTIDGTQRVTTSVDEMGRSRGATYTPNLDVATSTSGTGATAGTSTGTYGANSGQSLTSLQKPGGSTSSAAYTNTAPATAYQPSSTTDDSGNQSNYTYNGAGNLASSQNAALAATANVTYNTDGTVATATAPGNGTNATVYGYNGDHQLTTVTPPTGTSLGVKTTTYDYFGRPATTTDGKGVTLTYGYDKIDRLVSTTFSDTTHSVVNTYDDAGHLLTTVDGSGTMTNTYDQLGRMLTTVNTAGGGTMTYTYDKASRLASTVTGEGTTTYGYDDSGLPVRLTYPKGSITQRTNFAVDDQGRRTDTWLQTNPTNSAWSAHTHTTYDTSGRITAMLGESGPATAPVALMNTTLCYNAATSAPTCGTGATTDKSKLQWTLDNLTGQITAYTYDGGGRLLTAIQSGGTAANSTWTYTYDVNGNRLSAVVTGATTSNQTFTFNAGNQVTTAGYTYDGAGNLTASPTATYKYNGAEQMISATIGGVTATYTYGGTTQNRVLSETSSGKQYKLAYGRSDLNGQPVIERYEANTNVGWLKNDSRTGQPIMLTSSAGTLGLYITDQGGSPVGMITDYYSTAFSLNYDPYGVPILKGTSPAGNGWTQNPYLFKGGIQDRASGLVKFGIRWYNPTTGTFTQQDTLDAPLDPSNANRYAFAGADPVNHQDPTGNACMDYYNEVAGWFGVAGAAFGIAAIATSETIVGGLTFGDLAVTSAGVAAGVWAMGEVICWITD